MAFSLKVLVLSKYSTVNTRGLFCDLQAVSGNFGLVIAVCGVFFFH